ncbi:MAG: exosortase C-terminal domain/associated protein EpsI [Thermoguttaceae bacterium]
MFRNTSVRIYIVVALIGGTYLVGQAVPSLLKPSEVVLPRWTFNEMPKQWGDWRGSPGEWDPQIAVTTGADRIVNLVYRDDRGHVVPLHTAMFTSMEGGVYHNPFNCYSSHGWQEMKRSEEKLHLHDGRTMKVSLSTWDRAGERKLVVYWYQVGDQVLFGRGNLGALRWSMRGHPRWPAMIKVLMEISAPDQEDAKLAILSLAEFVANWENSPEHRKETQMFDTAKAEK